MMDSFVVNQILKDGGPMEFYGIYDRSSHKQTYKTLTPFNCIPKLQNHATTPRFYFDAEKNRYFLIKNPIPNQVAGGDGTASWLLRLVSDLKLHHPSLVATVPLGTRNNLPFAFGWICGGGKYGGGLIRNGLVNQSVFQRMIPFAKSGLL